MQVELYCPQCCRRFPAAPDTPAAQVVDGLTEQGPWTALGDGETFEDSLAATLAARGADHCPRCGETVRVSEESLGRLTMQVLATW